MNWKGVITMRRLTASAALPFACAFVWTAAARAQGGRGAPDWMTAGGDAQRSSWVRTDPKISVSSVEKPGFQVAWKIKLNSEPSVAVTLDRYIGYRGFRSFALVGSRSGDITAFDTDLGRIEWKKSLAVGAAPRNASAPCPGGMTANVARPTGAGFPANPGGRGGGGGRGNAAKSAVGAPDEGAVTIAEIAARAAAAPAPPPAGRGPAAGAAAGRGAAYNPFAARASFLNAISSDGMFHSMYISNGEEPAPPVAFLPANAHAHGLIVLGSVAYSVTSGSCGSAPNGVWALDIASKEVARWTPDAGDVAGSAGAAFGPDETAYVATTGGELVALEPKTLQVKATYHSGDQAFVSSPVVFEYGSESSKATMIAAATADGRLHLVAASSPAPAPLTGAAYPAVVSGALATWQDAAGAHWLAAPSNNSIAAWKVADQGGAPVLQPGWTSREIVSPLAPIVVNGVVFAVSGSSPAVLYALDGATGKELWNSGKMLSAAVRYSGLSSIGSQLYLGASDGTFYAFGFPIEH
jgi:outer membrane protein assembly factor BamB